MKRIIKRCGIIFLWLALFITFIYFPSVIKSSPDEKSITILTWGDILHPDVIKNIEKNLGIKVYLNFYSSNEELLVKMKATKGRGYDLIVPSDYAVQLLAQYDLLKKIDKAQLNFIPRINPALLGQYYDKENSYSIPYSWEVFVLGYNKEFFHQPLFVPSWSHLFDVNQINYPIVMTNDPIEAIQFASFYLYGNKPSLSANELALVQSTLIAQRLFIEAYASFRADYFLATKTSPLVITSSSYILRTKKHYPYVGLSVPKEGSFVTIENLAIPKISKKEKTVYQFLNELYKTESARKHYEEFCFFPAVKLENYHEEDAEIDNLLKISADEFKRFHFISELVTQEQIQNLWVNVKSSPTGK